MISAPSIVWFREDLRIADNPALASAATSGRPVIPVFIWPGQRSKWALGEAARWWLFYSLEHLDKQLRALGSRLIVRGGDPIDVITELIETSGADSLYFNRRYDPEGIRQQQALQKGLAKRGLNVRDFNATLLVDPDLIKTQKGNPYKVFTPFWNSVLALPPLPLPVPAPDVLAGPKRWPSSESLNQLYPRRERVANDHLQTRWTPGAGAAIGTLEAFLSDRISNYLTGHDRPDYPGTSFLSPHLRFGEIGPRQIWHSVVDLQHRTKHDRLAAHASGFLRQLVWREFAYHLLYHYPHTTDAPLRSEFLDFPWRKNKKLLEKWKAGQTGYPIVDAGMRQLLNTGWMHNRVRMVVASFLVKDLLIPWTLGARWFWEKLVDADLANNTLGWQWVAGCGADAAPFFRIFNPVKQGEKFDPEGVYVRRWVPELVKLQARWIHRPWENPDDVINKSYPSPIVNHSIARQDALTAYNHLKSSSK